MDYVFSKCCRGYLHKNERRPCQDFALSYVDKDRTILAVADGHGGKQYIRSQKGSKFACEAVLTVFKGLKGSFFKGEEPEGSSSSVKLSVLCEYNRLVEADYSKHPFRKEETKGLTEDQIEMLRQNPVKAYGTTLTGFLRLGDQALLLGIGDSEVFLLCKGRIIRPLDAEDDPAGNITYSMCQEDAFSYMRVAAIKTKDLDGVLLCTDGLTSPYQSYFNFEEGFVKPNVYRLLSTESLSSLSDHVGIIASKIGVGDDTSLALYVQGRTKKKLYSPKE